MADFKRISTEGGPGLSHNPFASLSAEGLPAGSENSGGASVLASRSENSNLAPAKKNRDRVDVLRVKAGRGGKTVTLVKNFVGIGLPEKEMLAKKMQRACGVGGTVKDGHIEIQGDKREEVARILEEAGFRAVFAGG